MSSQADGLEIPSGGSIWARFEVNGEDHEVEVQPGLRLVDLVRERLGLKGTHVGCGTGDCGACTVRLDGQIVKSCLVLAASAVGARIATVESLGQPGSLHPVQQAFWDVHGFQCGFCLPGMLFAALELLEEDPQPDEATVRRSLSGNLCRCTGYQTQVAAVLEAARRLRSAAP